MRLLTIRRALVALAASAVMALPLAGATAASAAPLRPQQFTITGSSASPNGTIDASGPINGTGTDFTVGNSTTLDRFAFPRGSFLVRHTDVSNVPLTVNRRTCTATGTATGTWRITPPGTGRYRDARGFGRFTFRERAILNRLRNGRCDVNPNHQPRFFSYRVDAFGQAALR